MSEKLLLLALYVDHRYDGKRKDQCVKLYELSDLLGNPLPRVPAEWTFVKYLKKATEKNLTIQQGKDLFQGLDGGAA